MKKRRSTILALLLLVVGWQAAMAQAINGKVVDKDGKALQYVNCVLRNLTDSAYLKGAVTQADGTFSLEKPEAERQRVRPLKLVILNLMPKKIETETQLLRLISKSPLQVEIDFMKTSTVQYLTQEGLANLASTIETLATAEGLHAHCESVKVATLPPCEEMPSFKAEVSNAVRKPSLESRCATCPISCPITPSNSSSVMISISEEKTRTLPSAQAKALTSVT